MSKKDPHVWEPITPDFLLSSPFLSSSPHPFSSRVLNCGPSLILICCFDMKIMALIIHSWDLLLPPRDGWEIVCEVRMMVGLLLPKLKIFISIMLYAVCEKWGK